MSGLKSESAPPYPTPEAGQAALKALLDERSLLPALAELHRIMGPVFRLSAPRFQPVVMAGPEAAHFVLVEARRQLSWRSENDPVTHLLRQGLLVTDGSQHDHLRRMMSPALHRQHALAAVPKMVLRTDQVCNAWSGERPLDMLVEMRRAALLILMDALFDVDISADLSQLWPDILRVLKYISPGLWLVWEKAPRPGYQSAIQRVDDYLHALIASRRTASSGGKDLLSLLVSPPESTGPVFDSALIRDQLLTMMIAGHDTSTALLAWALFLLGKHPQAMQRARAEVDGVLKGQPPQAEHMDELVYLEQVIQETLRLYPPIHIGNRITTEELDFKGCRVPAGERLMYSIYATHRDPQHWPNPHVFDPDRFAPGTKRAPYTFIPFGGGPRNCIGAAFAQIEAKVVLARLLQRFDLVLTHHQVRQSMGATLEPRPGVLMRVRARP